MHIENMTVHVGSSQLAALLARLIAEAKEASAASASAAQTAVHPRIGDAWPGVDGVYAGVARGEDGGADHHLVLLNAKPTTRLSWDAAKEWAASAEASLPTRFESALLYANLRDQFDTSAWHWTGTQSSGGDAWSQHFGYGTQGTDDKSYEAACRAVRRFPL